MGQPEIQDTWRDFSKNNLYEFYGVTVAPTIANLVLKVLLLHMIKNLIEGSENFYKETFTSPRLRLSSRALVHNEMKLSQNKLFHGPVGHV